jgi:multidrug efflux pump subunit AcrA (membrane-fusion protein)
VGLLVAVAVVLAVTGPFGGSGSPSGMADNAYPTSLATVVEEPISSQTQESATLGYAGSYTVVNQAQGTYTSLPSVGQVVQQGQVLYKVSGSPVVLLYGSTPAYRTLAEGASASDVTGADVQQLNADIVALGYVSSADLSPTSDEFGFWTKVGVEDLQAALGAAQNGTLALGSYAFLPTAARITAVTPTLGDNAQPGGPALTATSTNRLVTIDLSADQQSEVKAGDKVTITLPDGSTTPGVVWSVGTVATTPSGGGGGSPTVTVDVVPTNPAATGHLDQAPVEVSITSASAPSALVVPINALLALSGGGYAVEVVAAGVHHLVPVNLGIFDDAGGKVQVTGTGLAAGQRVVVPSS